MSTIAVIPVDKEKINRAVQMNIPISINTYTLPKETETYIVDVAKVFLAAVHHEDIQDYIVYCLNELTTNAKKAMISMIKTRITKGLRILNKKALAILITIFKSKKKKACLSKS